MGLGQVIKLVVLPELGDPVTNIRLARLAQISAELDWTTYGILKRNLPL